MSEREEFLEKSVNAIGLLKREAMADMIRMLQKARDEKANVFVLGNGGSSSTASHFVCDLLKTSIKEGQNRFRAFSLTDNVPVMTAWANDVDYNSIFVEQLKNVIKENDLDPIETNEWIESLSAVIEKDGNQRSHYLIKELINNAYMEGANIPYTQSTPYINTIPVNEEKKSNGDKNIERKAK